MHWVLCRFFLCLFVSLFALEGICQTRQLTANVIGGLATVPTKEKYDEAGVPQKMFGGFKPGLFLEAGVYYHFKNQFFVGLAGQHFGTTKSNYSLGSTGVMGRFGYVFVVNPRHLWPYIFVGAGGGQVKMHRSNYKQYYKKENPSYDENSVAVNTITYSYGEANFSETTLGLEAGLGLDLVVYRRWAVNIQAAYAHYFLSKKKFLDENFVQKPADLNFITTTLGVSYTLKYRDKKKDINNLSATYLHNKSFRDHQKQGKLAASKNAKLKELAKTHIPHVDNTSANKQAASKPGYLSELKNSHSIEKKNLKEGAKYSVIGKVTGSNSLTEAVVITDKKGNVVKRSYTKNGYFAYTNLNPDDYDIKFESKNPNLKMELKTQEDNGLMKVGTDEFQKYDYKKINKGPLDNMVQGRVKTPVADQTGAADFAVLLVNDKNEIVGKTTANKNGYFAFNKIKADNYTALVESNNSEVKPEIKVADDDPALRLSSSQIKDYHYVALNQNQIDGAIVVGKGTVKPDMKPLADQTILLVDSKGNVRETQTSKLGHFAFKNLKNEDYQIVVENPDPAIQVTAYPVADMSQLIVPSGALLSNNYHKLKGDNVANNVLLGNLNIKDRLKPVEDLEILLLNDSGTVVSTTKPNVKGQFAFKGLLPDNYKVVVNHPEERLHAHLQAPVNDPALMFSPDELKSYNPTTKKYEKLSPDDKLHLSGNIQESATAKPLEDQTVFLIDGTGKVADVSQTGKDGSFTFDNKSQAAYQVVFEGKENKQYTSQLDVYKQGKDNASSKSPTGKNPVTLHYKSGATTVDGSDTSKVTHFVKHILGQHTGRVIKLRVYASGNERDAATKALNKKRAEEVKAKLLASGVPAANIKIEDMGVPLQKGTNTSDENQGGHLDMIEEE
jgi:hypothetical protein